MTGRRVLGIERRRVVVCVSAVCVLLCLLCLLRVVDGFDGAWEDAFGPSERANERPLVDDERGRPSGSRARVLLLVLVLLVPRWRWW